MTKVGNRIRSTFERPPRELVEKFRDAPLGELCDAMSRTGAMRDLVPLYRPMRSCVGTALTVKAPAGDSLMVRKAMELAEKGDVIVIDGRGVTSRAIWGGNRSRYVAKKGIEAVIVDGASRDVDETQSVDLPHFGRAICPMGSSAVGPGEINFPIACGGVVVSPGDIIVANEEGIVVVPREDAEAVYQQWRAIAKDETTKVAIATAGELAQKEETDRLLGRAGTEILS